MTMITHVLRLNVATLISMALIATAMVDAVLMVVNVMAVIDRKLT